MDDRDMENGGETEEESFEALFEAYGDKMSDDLQLGDKITGSIVAIDKDLVYIDTGTKTDGTVEKKELLDDAGNLPFGVGDRVELYVVAKTENELKLSKVVSGIGGMDLLKEAFQNKMPVEGKVQSVIKGGFQVEVLKRRAFCPVSQMDAGFTGTPETHIGNVYPFLITKLEDKGKNIVLSRRKLIEAEQKKAKDAFLKDLKDGALISGRVKNIMPYGIFVEIAPGVEGMVHVSELAWSRVDNPAEVFKLGDAVTIKVIGLKKDEKKDQIKISLSIKQAEGDPWLQVTDRFEVGQKVRGTVTRLMKFGAFIEIAPGIEGLVHISEMSFIKRVTRPEDVVTPGESVMVQIKGIDPGGRRISLSIRDTEGDPWEDIATQFKVGDSVQGTVEKKESFGFFVRLAPGITGLFPKSNMARSANPAALETLKVGAPVTVVVEQIQIPERRISLGPADAQDTEDWKKYSNQSQATESPVGLGTLGDKLRQALNAKMK
jgi:small subunit ribosomal protein S1